MRGLTGTEAEVGAVGAGEETVYTNKLLSSPSLVTGKERENRVVSKNVTSVDTK